MKQAPDATGRAVNAEANALADYHHLAKVGGVDVLGVLGHLGVVGQPISWLNDSETELQN